MGFLLCRLFLVFIPTILFYICLFIYSLKDITLRYPINVDGHFLTKPVNELFNKHELLTVPFMTGANSDEGGWLLGQVSVKAKL